MGLPNFFGCTMNKYLTLLIIFIFPLILMLTECFATEETGEKGNTKHQPNQIDSLRLEIDELKREISYLQEKATELKLEKKASEALLTISEKNLDAPKCWYDSLVNIIYICVGFLTAILGIVTTLLFIVRAETLRRYTKLENRIQINFAKLRQEVEDERKQFREFRKKAEREIYELLGKSSDQDGVQAFYRNKINLAIEYGEAALEQLEKAYGKEPEKLEERFSLASVKSNLAYYYVVDNRTEKEGISLQYAEEGLELGKQLNDINKIDNFLYVFKEFGKDREAKRKWKEVYENYKKELNQYDKLSSEEREEYEAYLKKINEEVDSKNS